MPRPPRQEGENAVHHVVAQGNRRRSIVADDLDRIDLIRRLAVACSTFEWACFAYCVLDTHAHLILRTREPNLGTGMRTLLGGHARAFNSRHNVDGHVFRRPYYSRRVLTEEHLYASAMYVVLNPVAAGLCAHPSDWAWCSYRQTAFGEPGLVSDDAVLRCFGSDEQHARGAYRRAVDEAVARAGATSG